MLDLNKLSFEELDKLLEKVVEARNVAWEKMETLTIPHPGDGWNCFHCGMVFHHEHQARLHFGPTPESTPRCILERDTDLLVRQLRTLEEKHHEHSVE